MRIVKVIGVLATVSAMTSSIIGNNYEALLNKSSLVSDKSFNMSLTTVVNNLLKDDEEIARYSRIDYFFERNKPELTLNDTDKSSILGIHSSSCDDAYKFLKEDYKIDYDKLINEDWISPIYYTGRFEYPELTGYENVDEIIKSDIDHIAVHSNSNSSEKVLVQYNLGRQTYAPSNPYLKQMHYMCNFDFHGTSTELWYVTIEDDDNYHVTKYQFLAGPFTVTMYVSGYKGTKQYKVPEIVKLAQSIEMK